MNKKDNKCFQYAVTVTLNYEEIKKDLQRITNIKPFINKYNWEGINFEKNNVTTALNVLYTKKEKIYLAYVSKHNPNGEKQVILLMIPNGEKWHYLSVKKLSALLRGITSKHDGDFYCLNCLYSFRTKSKLDLLKKVCENKDFCNIIMPFEDTILAFIQILEFNHYRKSGKTPFIT